MLHKQTPTCELTSHVQVDGLHTKVHTHTHTYPMQTRTYLQQPYIIIICTFMFPRNLETCTNFFKIRLHVCKQSFSESSMGKQWSRAKNSAFEGSLWLSQMMLLCGRHLQSNPILRCFCADAVHTTFILRLFYVHPTFPHRLWDVKTCERATVSGSVLYITNIFSILYIVYYTLIRLWPTWSGDVSFQLKLVSRFVYGCR